MKASLDTTIQHTKKARQTTTINHRNKSSTTTSSYPPPPSHSSTIIARRRWGHRLRRPRGDHRHRHAAAAFPSFPRGSNVDTKTKGKFPTFLCASAALIRLLVAE